MKHGGNIDTFARQIGCLPSQVLDFSANINPEQALDWRQLSVNLSPYADPDYSTLKQVLKQRYQLPLTADCEVFNGASAAIFALLAHLKPHDVILYTPIYSEYERIAQQLGCTLHKINRFSPFTPVNIPEQSTVIFVNPATPDGTLYDMPALLAQWQAAGCTILIDESFLDFCTADSTAKAIPLIKNLYLIKSLSKFYGCAGVRVGFVSADAALIADLKRHEPAWKLSSFDMAYIQTALSNRAFIEHTRAQTAQLRALLQQTLQQSGLFETLYPSQANFLLARLADRDAYVLQQQLAPARILLRVCDSFDGLDARYVRFAVKEATAIAQLAHALSHV